MMDKNLKDWVYENVVLAGLPFAVPVIHRDLSAPGSDKNYVFVYLLRDCE